MGPETPTDGYMTGGVADTVSPASSGDIVVRVYQMRIMTMPVAARTSQTRFRR